MHCHDLNKLCINKHIKQNCRPTLLFVVVKNHTKYWWNDETYKNKTISYYLLLLKITKDLSGIL